MTNGLTKREYMATSIMAGLCAGVHTIPDHNWTLEDFASEAVELADALINELNKPQP